MYGLPWLRRPGKAHKPILKWFCFQVLHIWTAAASPSRNLVNSLKQFVFGNGFVSIQW